MNRRKGKRRRSPHKTPNTGPVGANAPPAPPAGPDRAIGRRWLAAIFLLALAYRAWCFGEAGGHPLFRYPVVDAGYHDDWALRMAAGDWLGHGPDDVFKPPLYPGFLALLYCAFGRHVWLIQCVQHLLGALSCVLVAVLGARLLGRNAGRLAGLIAAIYAPFVFFELQLLTPAVSVVLNLAALLLLLPAEGRPGGARLAAAGALLGLSAGFRPDVLMPAAMLFGYLVWQGRDLPWRRLAAGAACGLLGAALVLLPIVLRNYYLTRQFIPVSSNAGINFYVGNSAGADGVSAVPVGLHWERLVGRVPQEVLERPATASRWWLTAAWHEIAADPAAELGRLGRKTLAFSNRREFRNNVCFHFVQQSCWPLWPSPGQYALVLPLAVSGLIWLGQRGGKRNRRALALCLLWIAGYGLAGVLFFVTARFRVPAVPMLILPAAFALPCLAEAVRRRERRSLLLHALVLLAAVAVCWPPWFGTPADGWVRDEVNLGNALISAGDPQGAVAAYRRALELRPDDPDAHFKLGHLLLPRDPARARRHFEAAYAVMPDAPSVLLALAEACLRTGDVPRAKEHLHELLRLSETMNLLPRRDAWAKAHLLLAGIEREKAPEHWERAWSIDPRTAAEASLLGRRDLARVVETFRDQAAEKPWDWYSQANLGMALWMSGRAAEAVPVFRQAARLAPEREVIRFHLARTLLDAGQSKEALKVLSQLHEELPRCPLRDQVDALRGRIEGEGR
jgi:tetratricopeptide (TPR) repeat protein